MMPRWATASIRLRLTAWYTLVLALMLTVYAAATYIAVRHEFFEQLDDQLHDDFEAAQSYVSITPAGRVVWSADAYGDPDKDNDRGTDVWVADGSPLYRSDATAGLPAGPLSSQRRPFDSLSVNGHKWRTLTGAAPVGGRPVTIRVARSEDRVRGELREILAVLVLGLPLVVVLASAGGYVLARRALAPIDRLAVEARRITADKLHDRLSVPNPHDEIGRLAAVINETFARLESSFDQLRRFTADASHELRTPLAVMRGIGEVGLAETRTASEYKETIGSMLEEVDRLTSLVESLLRLSHGDAGTIRLLRAPTDLGQLVREVGASLAILAEERRQHIDVEAADGHLALVDRLVLREAITNVVDNAIKYSPDGSTIQIRVGANANDTFVTVADQGRGIAPEHRQRIFDRFFRIDEARSREQGGTGLGLAIAKWAVDVNGGQIAVEPHPNGGSVFRITLPLHRPASHDKPERMEQRMGVQV